MPPKKKKAPKNAFWFFAMEWKAEKEEQGQRFRDLTEVTTLCSDDWKYLPENLRNRYKDMEKKAKQTSKGDTSNKYNSLGVSFDELERQQREERMAEQTMFNYIDATMKKLSISENELKHHFFYLIHVNTYCYWGNIKAHIPCEVAISKFNLDKGVVDWFHVFPAPRTDNADLPVGYKFEAMENAKQVHGIPLPGDWDNKNEKDWSKIADDVLEFLTPHNGDEVPPIFTMDGATAGGSNINCEIQAVKDFFDIISDITGKDFRVYSLSLLYFKLYDTCQLLAESLFGDKERAFPVEGVAYNQLTKDIYNYCPGIACQFHETTDMFHNCSLSFVRRWVFLMSEFCCKALRIPLIPGSHCISNADIATPLVLPEVVVPRQPSSHPVSRPLSTQGHLEEQNVFADSRRGRNTAIQSPVTSNNFCANNPVLEECDGPPSEGWSTVARGQSSMRTSRANHQKPSGSNSASPIIIDNLKEPDPAQTRIFRTGQSANCVSEVMPDTAGSSVRLPTTRGRGEVMAEMLRQHQSTPGASFSADDFPAIGGTRPGQLSRPMAKGWGRGFLQQ